MMFEICIKVTERESGKINGDTDEAEQMMIMSGFIVQFFLLLSRKFS